MAGRLTAICAVEQPGGAEIHLLRLLEGLLARGWQATVTTPGPETGALAQRVRALGSEWQQLSVGGLAGGSGRRALLSWPGAHRLASRSDVVLLGGGVCGRLLPALPGGGALRVLHIHDMVERVPSFWSRADLVLADSGAVAQRLRELAGLSSEVVYGPVDPDPPSVPSPWPADPRVPVIGFVGRIEPRKGPLDLIRAAPLIRASVPGARVVIIGDDPYGSDPGYVRAVRSSAEVEHLPWSEDAPGLMRHLSVLVLPSRQEPFGTVLAEAMAVGTPVVATDVDGLPEVVQDGVTGRLVACGSPEGLAAGVLEVLANRTRMGAAAREHARRFHTDAYVERVEGLFVAGAPRLAGGRPSASAVMTR